MKNGMTKREFEEQSKIKRTDPLPVTKIDFADNVIYPENAEALVRLEGWQSYAQNLKIAADFEKKRIANAKDRGKLIERSLVEHFIAKLYTVDTNEFLASCGRISNLVAGICGVNDEGKILEVENAVQVELYKTLAHIKRLMDDYLRELERKCH
jgi:hypothetical protein